MLLNWLAEWKQTKQFPGMSKRKPRRRFSPPKPPLQAEVLEDRTLLAVTAIFAVDTLTVTLDAEGDHAFIRFEDGNIIVSDGENDVYSDADNIRNLVILDAGVNADQQVTFGGSNIITATTVGDDLTLVEVTGIETANVNQLIEVATITGDAEVANVAAPGLIQHGINLVAAGGTVNVGAGTYVEDLVIDATKTDLELAGAGSASTTIKGIATNLQTSFPLATPNINILAAGVQLHGFTIESPDVPAGSYSSGILIDSPDVEIFNNAFVSIQGDTPPTDANDSLTNVIIQTWADSNSGKASDVDGLFIHDNTFTGDGKGYYGVFVNPQGEPVGTTAADTVRIEDNTFTGNIWRAVEVERSNAVIDGNVITPSAQTLHAWGGSGISVRDFGTATIDDVTISNNTIVGVDASLGQGFANGILLGFGTETLTNITVTGNVVSANETGIRVNTSADGITVFNNSITGNTIAVNNTSTTILDASGNWWGTTDDAAIDALTTGLVDFTPFLVSGTDTKPETAGFQGDFSTLHVTNLGEQVGPTGRIQEGVDLVDDGGTVNVAAADYAEVVNASATGTDKDITFGIADVTEGTGIVGTLSFTVDAGDALVFEINGVDAPSTDYDQLSVTGTVTLNGATLVTSGTVTGTGPGDEVILIANDGADAVVGTFNGLAEGATVVVNGQVFTISYVGGDGNDVVLLGTDDPPIPPELVISDASTIEGTGGTTTMEFSVTLSRVPDGTVTVDVNTMSGTATSGEDFLPLSQTLTFTPEGPLTQIVSVSIVPDDIVELDEEFFVILSNASGATIVEGTATGLILDDDGPAIISINNVTQLEGDSGSTLFNFVVTLDRPVDVAVSVEVSTAVIDGPTAATPGVDFISKTETVTFQPGVFTQTFSVEVLGDTIQEFDEIFLVRLENVESSGRDVQISDTNGTGTGTILNDDVMIVVGPGPGAEPRVLVYDQLGNLRLSILAFDPNFQGGVTVALGDVTGDGTPDIIVGAGPGGGPHVRTFDGVSGEQIAGPLGSFFAYDVNFTGGVFVSAADLNGDLLADIVTGAGSGGGPHVRAFSASDNGAVLLSFFAYGAGFTGGVRVATGDVTGNGTPEIITGAGPGGGPHVRTFDGTTGSQIAGSLGSFFAYDAGFTGGVFVSAADLTGDLRADIITGAGSGGGPHVRVFRAADGGVLHSFFAFDSQFTGGVRVGATDQNVDGQTDILVGAGSHNSPQVRVFDGNDLTVLNEFSPFPTSTTDGVFVAGTPLLPLPAILASGEDLDLLFSDESLLEGILS